MSKNKEEITINIEDVKDVVIRIENLEYVREHLDETENIIIVTSSGKQINLLQINEGLVDNLKPYLYDGLDDLETVAKDEIRHFLNDEEE